MNRNTLYAQLFVDSLIAAGLKHVCLAPGSRNTPLVLAFANRKDKINITSHLDERSMAFFALGLARAINEPVAIVCTSGSAAANFFPAIVEAHQSRIPMIVLTADRPPELRHSGANQTIDQVKMFGDYALWFVDAPLPEANPSNHLLLYVRTLARRAVDTANGMRKGVVHINMPFRPPLEPTEVEGDTTRSDWDVSNLASYASGSALSEHAYRPQLLRPLEEWVFYQFDNVGRGLIVVGPNAVNALPGMDWSRLIKFANQQGYPIFADAASGIRFHYPDLVGAYDVFLPIKSKLLENIDIIIRFGDVPTSKALNTALQQYHPDFYVHITADGVWADDSYWLTHVLPLAEWTNWMEHMLARSEQPQNIAQFQEWAQEVIALDKTTWTALAQAMGEKEFEGAFVRDMLHLLTQDSGILVVGNSMPVRHLDFWGRPLGQNIDVYANRGASGIDGNISTALGTGMGYISQYDNRPDDPYHKRRPLILLIGDVTFYHDMNGLLAIQRCGVPIVIVLLNNNGGGIFRTLPVKDYEPSFTEYFITPHALDFSHVGPLYGLQHQRLTTRAEFREAFPKAIDAWREGKSTLLEIMTDSNVDVATRREILADVQAKLRDI